MAFDRDFAAAVTDVRRDIKLCKESDAQLIALLAFVCEALCEMQPELRDGFMARVRSQLLPYQDREGDQGQTTTLRAGLEAIEARLLAQ